MTLRRRSLLAIAIAIVTVMAILYLVASTIVLNGFATLEERTARENLKRVTDAYGDMVANLDYITADWAGWDDTYKFIQDGNREYLEGNVVDGTLAGLRLNLLLYLKPNGRVAFGTGFDHAQNKRGPLPAAFLDHVESDRLLVTHRTTESYVAGVVLLPEAPMLVASRPILTSDRKGPIRGTLIFGRYLDQGEVDRLAELTHFTLALQRFDAVTLPEDMRDFRRSVDAGTMTIIRTPSATTIAGYTVLPDIHGRPALLLRVQMPRAIFAQGQTTILYFLAGLLLVGLLLGGATLVLFDRLILSRFARQESEERFRDLFENANDIVFTTDLNWNITSLNRAGERITGFTRGEALTRNVAAIIAPEHRELAEKMLSAELGGSGPTTYEIDILSKDGRRIPVEVSTRLTLAGGKPVALQGIARDVTERKQAEAALRESEERYALAAQGANDGLWDWDLRTGTVYYSARWKAMLGYEDTELGTSPQEWFGRVQEPDLADLRAQLAAHLDGAARHLEFEYRIRHKDGSVRWMLCRGFAVRDPKGRAYRIAGSQTDITERKRVEEQLLHDAFHDGLSGLPNRALFHDRLSQAIRRAQRHTDVTFGVLFLDIDRFKLVNDSLGHSAGDELIKAIARRLDEGLRATDTVARLGGDEFAILLSDVKDAADAQHIASRVLQGLAAPFALAGRQVFVMASIGIALSDGASEGPEEYLRNADVAMYRAKAAGGARCVIFDPEMQARTAARWQLETDLRRALEHDEFRVHYQPIVSLSTGQIVGFEALARWQHPQRGLVSPAEFIPVAEETGMITAVGRWVLREASRQSREWAQRFTTPLFVGVNLSARQLDQPDLIEQVRTVIQQTGVDSRALKLEITESVIMENVDAASATLDQLHALNLQLSVDDFGTGYSSLGTLRRFPISTIKIDRSFVAAMTGAEGAEIVRTIVTLAHNLGMDVVAEGVETAEQLAMLKALGCEYAQGYFFSRPVDAQGATGLLVRLANWAHLVAGTFHA